MTKTKTLATIVCALSLIGIPALTSAAFAQGAAEPMKGAEPMTSGSGGSMEKGSMSKGGMNNDSMSKKSMSKKSMKKKHKKSM